MLPRILALILCCSFLSCKDFVEKYKRSNSGISSREKKVLYDFRYPQLTIGPGSFCPTAPLSCTAELSNVNGSFTYAAEQEKACLYRCPDTNKLQISSQGKIQVSTDTPYSAIIKTFDLNHDDKNELLFTVETTQNGRRTVEASLQTIEKGTLRAVEDFGIVYRDPCALFSGASEVKKKQIIANGVSPFIEAVLISYLPRPGHEMPAFTAERLYARCPASPNAAPSNWQLSPK